jgi:hypothetical protein
MRVTTELYHHRHGADSRGALASRLSAAVGLLVQLSEESTELDKAIGQVEVHDQRTTGLGPLVDLSNWRQGSARREIAVLHPRQASFGDNGSNGRINGAPARRSIGSPSIPHWLWLHLSESRLLSLADSDRFVQLHWLILFGCQEAHSDRIGRGVQDD